MNKHLSFFGLIITPLQLSAQRHFATIKNGKGIPGNQCENLMKQIQIAIEKSLRMLGRIVSEITFIATNQRVVAAKRQQGGLVAVTIRGSVLFCSIHLLYEGLISVLSTESSGIYTER